MALFDLASLGDATSESIEPKSSDYIPECCLQRTIAKSALCEPTNVRGLDPRNREATTKQDRYVAAICLRQRPNIGRL